MVGHPLFCGDISDQERLGQHLKSRILAADVEWAAMSHFVTYGPKLGYLPLFIAMEFAALYLFWRRRNTPAGSDFTLGDLVVWAEDLEVAAAQIQKAYEWRIAQWSSFGNAVLTGILAFLSAAAIEAFKGSINQGCVLAVGAGTFSAFCLYLISQARMNRLRREFLAIYRALALLH